MAGSWLDEPATFAPAEYEANAQVALAYTCPCEWIVHGHPPFSPLAEGKHMLLTDALCSPACSAKLAACAVNYFNASGVMMSRIFNRLPESATVGAAPPPPPLNGDLDAEASYKLELVAFDDEATAYEQAAEAIGCTASLPASIISSNWSATLAAAVPWTESILLLPGSTAPNGIDAATTAPSDAPILNITLQRLLMAEQPDCRKFAKAPLVFVVFAPLWFILAVSWSWNTYYANLADAKDLHRLMGWVPIMQFIHGLLSLFYYYTCPWESILSLVYATFWSIVTILKEPVMLLCLLLVSKGWCITRNTLDRREVCLAGSILAMLYASVSVQMSLDTPLASVPMVIMYICMLIEVSWSILNNLRVLKAQLFALRSLGVDPTTTPAYVKYWMFVKLAVMVFLYAALEVPIHTIFSQEEMDLHYFWLFLAVHQVLEMSVAVVIGYQFRARPYNVLFEQVQQLANELADQMLPSITTIEVKEEMLGGEGLIAWRSDLELASPQRPQLPPTLVVLNPGDKEMPPPPRRSTSCGSSSGGGGGVNATAAAAAASERSAATLISSLPRAMPPARDDELDNAVELATFYAHGRDPEAQREDPPPTP